MATKQPKPIQVLARYALKDRETKRLTGTICYRIRSSNGTDTYCVRIEPGRPTTCNCPARTYNRNKPCSHSQHCERLEQDRSDGMRGTTPLVGRLHVA